MLEQLDPTREETFDADGPIADRVLARALAASPAAARPRRRAVVPAAVAGACAVAAAAVTLTGSGTDALGPQEALAQAVDRTAAFASGVASIHTVVLDPRGGISIDATQRVRFAPGASELTQRAAPGTPTAGSELDGAVWRLVDGHAYLRRPGGAWQTVPDVRTDAFADEARAISSDRDLRSVLENADDVQRAGDTFRATLTAQTVRTLRKPPFDIGAIHDVGDVEVTLTLKDDVISALKVAYGDVTRTISYESLGTPQDITAPPVR